MRLCNKYPLKALVPIYLLLQSLTVYGQSSVDVLQNKSSKELFDLYVKSTDKEDKIKYINSFISLAKRDKIEQKIISGYYILSGLYDDTTSLKYSDSIINLTSKNSTKYHPGLAYFAKASFHHNKGDFKNALDNYLLANQFAKKHEYSDLIMLSTYSIGTIKRKIGEYEEALDLYKESIKYSKKVLLEKKKSSYYLNTLAAISNVFCELKAIDSSTYYNELGVKESFKYNEIEKHHHFAINQGIINFIQGEYDVALDSISKHVTYFENIGDKKNISSAYYYLGKSFLQKNNTSEAIRHFKKVDSVFQIEKDVSPTIRESYEHLIEHYKRKDNIKKQLFYINRLMKFDSVIYNNQSYLSKKIFKEYDIPKLNSEKELILDKMKANEATSKKVIFFILLVLSVAIIFLIYQYNRRKQYKKRVDEILSASPQNIKNTDTKKQINIPEEIILTTLKGLEAFEKNQEFISKEITLSSLAKQLGTNANYFSKIINHYKDSSFSNYLNNLRIEYIVTELKTNERLRKYTIKAISNEAGFNNAESFSKAFYKLKGVKPSYFLRELNKTNL
ncbi:helix-turn-helix domain-containing protein [Aquimarina sp. 2201CG5-10]|uniref:helix-turn-helix domain-containing protein n=1 Tax=Aquimarina callyspongiae TaxID=3098150 RepID=UPI002AB36D30|nr:helix-turn-helix domain-containing protein [Aquimarina sp. 2201CG5-10]MDY8135575.1 helix-turn-helix domain-containing protein [Aquimarina sp. 2201CG5-10]